MAKFIYFILFLLGSETEVLRQELLELLEDVVDDEVLEDTAVICEASSESAATDWEIRNKVSSQKWKEARPFLLKNILATQDPHPHCGCQCAKQAVVRCLDCLPFPFLCEDCDTAVHSRFVLHNRESLTGGFRQPLSELRQQMGKNISKYYALLWMKRAILVTGFTLRNQMLMFFKFSMQCIFLVEEIVNICITS